MMESQGRPAVTHANRALGDEDETRRTLDVFYRIGRAGVARLSDGGGPFGFDIAVALMIDELVRGYGCDMIAETGCYLGDTTLYLARRYPSLPVLSCDIKPAYAAFAARRLSGCLNATVTCEDSPLMLARAVTGHARPLAYLDAHWGEDWPLLAELDTMLGTAGIAVIHDFDIGHERFSYDTYDGVPCGPHILTRLACPPRSFYVFNPAASPPLPCLQTGRRAGVAVVCASPDTGPLDACTYLVRRQLSAGASR